MVNHGINILRGGLFHQQIINRSASQILEKVSMSQCFIKK